VGVLVAFIVTRSMLPQTGGYFGLFIEELAVLIVGAMVGLTAYGMVALFLVLWCGPMVSPRRPKHAELTEKARATDKIRRLGIGLRRYFRW
jgi:hypothetical protein